MSTNRTFIPDLCNARALLPLVVIAQLVALVVVMAVPGGGLDIWQRLIVVSLYLHWISLTGAAALCVLRRFLGGLSVMGAAMICYLVLLVITLVISEAAFQIGTRTGIVSFAGPSPHFSFILRNLVIAAIVCALILRYFYVMDAWQQQVRAVANARYQALQARIRPHFLFNSLNSIAALIPGRPEEAEELVENLAELFRAVLRRRHTLGRLDEELELTRAYLAIEQLRLGDRLQIDWDIEEDLGQTRVPLLCLQPLAENAVYHGVERIPGGGRLAIRIRQDAKVLVLEVENPVPEPGERGEGSRSALDNIRQRLRLLYQQGAQLSTRRSDGMFCARMEIPV